MPMSDLLLECPLGLADVLCYGSIDIVSLLCEQLCAETAKFRNSIQSQSSVLYCKKQLVSTDSQ
jgi:hypothetical protein